jgi:hypothetical protein
MKTLHVTLMASALLLAPSFGQQTTADTNAANATRTQTGASARDGFTLRGAEVVLTKNGVTTKVDRDLILPNGLRVLANGSVRNRDGSSTALRPNQLLTLEGTFEDVVLTPEGVAPVSSVDTGGAAKAKAGAGARDGFMMVGADVFMTRSGVTEKVKSEVRLPNGALVKPNGTVTLGNGNSIVLRPDQMLDLSGVLHDAPVRGRR